jgi:hypothetical protein
MGLAGKRLEVRRDVLTRELRGESVLLDLASERYFGLDEVGTGMWRALTAASTIDEAVKALESEYEVDPQALRSDVAEFVQKLADAGLVDVHDA